MEKVNYMISGFCGAAAFVNFLTGQYVMAGVVLFFAVIAYHCGGLSE